MRLIAFFSISCGLMTEPEAGERELALVGIGPSPAHKAAADAEGNKGALFAIDQQNAICQAMLRFGDQPGMKRDDDLGLRLAGSVSQNAVAYMTPFSD
jgi:DNA-binding transcriptional regulator LsrR (DeoR family)